MAEASGSRWSFKFNAGAPEFVPRSQAQTQLPVTSYLYPYVPYVDGISCGSWIYVADQETTFPVVDPNLASDDNDDELNQIIIKQVFILFLCHQESAHVSHLSFCFWPFYLNYLLVFFPKIGFHFTKMGIWHITVVYYTKSIKGQFAFNFVHARIKVLELPDSVFSFVWLNRQNTCSVT